MMATEARMYREQRDDALAEVARLRAVKKAARELSDAFDLWADYRHQMDNTLRENWSSALLDAKGRAEGRVGIARMDLHAALGEADHE